jgi:hypothetical protein
MDLVQQPANSLHRSRSSVTTNRDHAPVGVPRTVKAANVPEVIACLFWEFSCRRHLSLPGVQPPRDRGRNCELNPIPSRSAAWWAVEAIAHTWSRALSARSKFFLGQSE